MFWRTYLISPLSFNADTALKRFISFYNTVLNFLSIFKRQINWIFDSFRKTKSETVTGTSAQTEGLTTSYRTFTDTAAIRV